LKDPVVYDDLNNSKSFISFFTDWQDEFMTSVWTGERYHGSEKDYITQRAASYTEICAPEYFGG